MTRLIVLFLISMAFSGNAFAGTIVNQDAHAIVMPKGPATKKKPEPCAGLAYATLDGVRYNLPRTFSMKFRKDAKTLIDKNSPDHPGINCAPADFGDVVGFATGIYATDDVDIALSLPSAPTIDGFPPQTNFDRFKDDILTALKNKTSVKFPDNMYKLAWGLSQVYMLPKAISPTGNGENAIIRCTLQKNNDRNGVCNGSYYLPNGLFISYTFGRSYFEEDQFTSLDQQIRARIEKLKVKK